jgi:hypothetical protein
MGLRSGTPSGVCSAYPAPFPRPRDTSDVNKIHRPPEDLNEKAKKKPQEEGSSGKKKQTSRRNEK